MEYSELVRTLLARRGITDPEHIAAFLQPDYALHTHSPFLLQGMDRAVERVLSAMEKGERIAVYADFDCDGIPGAALLSDFFKKIGYENFEVYLPHRDREGYGFHTEAIEALASRGVTLIITVDVGTTALDAVKFAKEKGVDVIVTDHHEITGALPDAVAVLNPKLGTYPFPHLCGAAVAFKLAQALISEGKKRSLTAFTKIPDGWEKWLLDMVAIATVADMVPLIGENRVLAHWGLQVLRKSQRAGINALVALLRLRKSELTEDDIGFSLAPRINAASRMDDPDLALRLLTTTDQNEAEQLAARLEALNASRKGVVASVVREARKRVHERYQSHEKVVVLGNTKWKPALLGLAANSIVGDRGGVVCLWGRDSGGRLKGSCRSDGSVSIVDLFRSARGAVGEYGGHARSGGFSVSHEQAHTLPDVLARAARELEHCEVNDARAPDATVTLSEVSLSLLHDVSTLAPFGMGNPKPLFLVSGATVLSIRRFGKEKDHVELRLQCARTGASARAFDFFKAPEHFTSPPQPGEKASVLATLERDAFSMRGGPSSGGRGPDALALRIVDVLPV